MASNCLNTHLGNGHLYLTTAFVLWTLTSFACHQAAKYFLTLTGSNIQGVVTVSIIQLIFCYVSTEITNKDGENKRDYRYRVLCRLGHVIATLATNYSLSLIHASSTFAIKMLEPVTSALIQWMVFGIPLPLSSALTIPVIVAGAIAFTGNPFKNPTFSLGLMLALASNLALAFRNIAMKKLFSGNNELTIRSYKAVVALGSVTVSSLLLFASLNTTHALVCTAAVTSAVFHVLYSYLSVAMVLKSVSVVTHAIINIFKRVFVVILMSLVGQREITLLNISGLAVCTFGLTLYAVQSRRQKQHASGAGTVSDQEVTGTPPWTNLMGRRVCSLFSRSGCLVSLGILMIVSITTSREQLHLIGPGLKHYLSKRPHRSMASRSDPGQLIVDKTLRFDNNSVDVAAFLKWRLVGHPDHTDLLSKLLPTGDAVIEEAQRIQGNVFGDLFGRFKYAMLFDVAEYENKGDPAIAAGEIHLLKKMGIQLVYYCTTFACGEKSMDKALALSRHYNVENLVMLLQGGGNMFSYLSLDYLRCRVLKTFPNHTTILFPQSIWLRYPRNQTRELEQRYDSHKHLTVTVRDKLSMVRLRNIFKTIKIVLVPDIAFSIGAVSRTQPPMYDILWLKRTDSESIHYVMPRMPSNISCHIADWLTWPSPKPKGMEIAFTITSNGFLFLQRGRVVITDRLHGHILSTLLGIPHVILDNSYKKISSYHDSWTRGMNNVRITNSGEEALKMAVELLHIYNHTLPRVMSYDSPYN